MDAVRSSGRRAGDTVIRALNQRGHEFALITDIATLRIWRERLARPDRRIEISVNVNRYFRSTHVTYEAVEIQRLTATQRRTQAPQEFFYARYNDVARLAHSGRTRPRLQKADRIILLVREFEADVNNGGFNQYLFNKGRRRARAAVAALRAIARRERQDAGDGARAPCDARATRGAGQPILPERPKTSRSSGFDIWRKADESTLTAYAKFKPCSPGTSQRRTHVGGNAFRR